MAALVGELRELRPAAPGDWHVEASGDHGDKSFHIADVVRWRSAPDLPLHDNMRNVLGFGHDEAVARMVAAEHNAIPVLVAEIERLAELAGDLGDRVGVPRIVKTHYKPVGDRWPICGGFGTMQTTAVQTKATCGHCRKRLGLDPIIETIACRDGEANWHGARFTLIPVDVYSGSVVDDARIDRTTTFYRLKVQ